MHIHFDLAILFLGIYLTDLFLHRWNYMSRNIYFIIVLVAKSWEHAKCPSIGIELSIYHHAMEYAVVFKKQEIVFHEFINW